MPVIAAQRETYCSAWIRTAQLLIVPVPSLLSAYLATGMAIPEQPPDQLTNGETKRDLVGRAPSAQDKNQLQMIEITWVSCSSSPSASVHAKSFIYSYKPRQLRTFRSSQHNTQQSSRPSLRHNVSNHLHDETQTLLLFVSSLMTYPAIASLHFALVLEHPALSAAYPSTTSYRFIGVATVLVFHLFHF